MGSLSPRLQVRISQKQILTPGLVQMVSLLQLNRLELKDMISAEVAQNPVLEEATEGGEELTPEELQPLLEAEGERSGDPADQSILEVTAGPAEIEGTDAEYEPMAMAASMAFEDAASGARTEDAGNIDPAAALAAEIPETKAADPFDEIDFGSYFDDYLDPGYKSPAAEISEKPSFETFLSSPVTLSDHLHSQLALIALPEAVRDAAEGIIGNLDENGYLTSTSEEIATAEGHDPAVMAEALKVVHSLDPAGVGSADLRECLLLQIESRNGKGRRGVEDRRRPSEAGGTAAVQGTGEGAAPAAGTHRDCDRRDPASGSAAGPALLGSGGAAGGAGRLHFERRRRLPDPDQRRRRSAAAA